MSGFEIAGIVPGAFPLLLEGLKGSRAQLTDVKTWWKSERAFDHFVDDIVSESIAFSQVIDLLVIPCERLTEDEARLLRQDENSILWHDPRIQVELKRRVQPRETWFFRKLGEARDVLNRLHLMLPFGKVSHSGTLK